MEGGSNPKNAARAKRASSQRSKAKHSRHGKGHSGNAPAAGAKDRAVAEDNLPSNWERYDRDGSGSDDAAAVPLKEGELPRPKSKGADYSELLSSEALKLFEDPPEPTGMTAMLLANGLGLWDWDSSYLQPVSSAAERQAARDAAALLSMDLGILGKNLSQLRVAQRLFVEDELFPNELRVGDRLGEVSNAETQIVSQSSTASGSESTVNLDHKILSDSPTYSRHIPQREKVPSLLFQPGPTSEEFSLEAIAGGHPGKSVEIAADAPPRGGVEGKMASASHKGSYSSLSFKLENFMGQLKGDTPPNGPIEKVREPVGLNKFEASAAEADLDDLLDMLDKQEAGSPQTKGSLDHSRSSSSKSDFLFLSQSKVISPGFQKITSKPEGGPSHQLYKGLDSSGGKKLEEKPPLSDVKGAGVLLSQDDDFDSWLDSI